MEKTTLYKKTEEIIDQMTAFRRELHRHPELSFEEHLTADAIIGALEREGIACRRVAGTGVLARIDGLTPSDRPVVLRADMDALPVCEQTGLEFASENEGVMHACGHDIHTTCLLGALIVLNRLRDTFNGTVLGLFQPGEELHPGGASIVLAEGVFDDVHPVAFIGQHVAPEIEAGKFGFRKGTYMASSDEIHFTVKGTGGHGGLPHTLTDPVVATAQVITALQQIVSRNAQAGVPTVLSIGKVIADGATNIIPSEVDVAGTLRTMDEAWRIQAKQRIREIIEGVCSAYGVTADIEIKDGFPNVVNNPKITQAVKDVATALVGKENIIDLDLRMTAEDFGFYTQRYPAVFYRLGVGFHDGGEPGRLHSSSFIANEEALPHGIVLMAAAALHFLK